MRTVQRDDATIAYDVWGSGPPVLALAPGGLRASRASTWELAPINPLVELADRFQVVGMDQRNTGTSFAPISGGDGWDTYAADQLAVMDALGIERFAVIGMCIGGAFIMRLIQAAPERIVSAVALQPIGQDNNLDKFREVFDEWRASIEHEHPEADQGTWDSCWSNLFGTEHTLFSVADSDLADIDASILVCQGDDEYHPSTASRHLAASIRHGELIETWNAGPARAAAIERIRAFLLTHADT